MVKERYIILHEIPDHTAIRLEHEKMDEKIREAHDQRFEYEDSHKQLFRDNTAYDRNRQYVSDKIVDNYKKKKIKHEFKKKKRERKNHRYICRCLVEFKNKKLKEEEEFKNKKLKEEEEESEDCVITGTSFEEP